MTSKGISFPPNILNLLFTRSKFAAAMSADSFVANHKLSSQNIISDSEKPREFIRLIKWDQKSSV
jgi:hypothetical protein